MKILNKVYLLGILVGLLPIELASAERSSLLKHRLDSIQKQISLNTQHIQKAVDVLTILQTQIEHNMNSIESLGRSIKMIMNKNR